MLVKYGMNDYETKVVVFDSKAALLNSLDQSSDKYILLEDPEAISDYVMVTYQSPGAMHNFRVGLMFYDNGVSLKLLSVPYRNLSLLSYDCTLTLLDLDAQDVVFSKNFSVPIVFCKCYPDSILVLTELDIYLLSYNGQVQNSHGLRDMLTDFSISGNTLFYHTDASPDEKTLDLLDFRR